MKKVGSFFVDDYVDLLLIYATYPCLFVNELCPPYLLVLVYLSLLIYVTYPCLFVYFHCKFL